ncbi:MAG: hypothetical protein ACOYD4_03955 [Solirubrobacterales bacterium]
MNNFSPRAQFQQNKQECEEFSNLASHPLLHKAFTHTLAEMAASGCNEAELRGARLMVEMFINLGESNISSPFLRSKPLKTYDRSPSSTPSDGTAKPGT